MKLQFVANKTEISCAVRLKHDFAMLFEKLELGSTHFVPVAGAGRIEAREANRVRKD